MDQEPLSNLEWAQMVDVSCVPAGENPKGELKSGHAILRGKMLPVTVQFGVWETVDWTSISFAHNDHN